MLPGFLVIDYMIVRAHYSLSTRLRRCGYYSMWSHPSAS